MAYTVVNNSVFASDEVADGTDVAQLNDNIEDTRTRVLVLESSGSVLVASEDVYTWSAHSEVGQTVTNNGGNDVSFAFETPTTQVLKPSARTESYINSSGQIDFSGLRYGDRLNITFEASVNISGLSALAPQPIARMVFIDGSTLSFALPNQATTTLTKSKKLQESQLGLASFAVADTTVGYEEKIIPLSLKIEVN